MSTAPEESGLATYGAFLKDEIAAQDARKTSFEARGLAVITTSGTLVTLLFALAALSTKRQATFVLPASAQGWLEDALALFFFAALLALATNVPLRYEAAKPDDIEKLLAEEPASAKEAAERDVAYARVSQLRSAKYKNSAKGWLLVFAMFFEVLAIGCVARAVSYII